MLILLLSPSTCTSEVNGGALGSPTLTGRVLNLEPLTLSKSFTSLTTMPIVELLKTETYVVWFVSLMFKADRFCMYAVSKHLVNYPGH